jgi:hypothetical protein
VDNPPPTQQGSTPPAKPAFDVKAIIIAVLTAIAGILAGPHVIPSPEPKPTGPAVVVVEPAKNDANKPSSVSPNANSVQTGGNVPTEPTPLPTLSKEQQEQAARIKHLEEVLAAIADKLNKPVEVPPIKPIAAEIKCLDAAGTEVTSVTVGSPIIVTAQGDKKEWTISVGKSKLITTPDGYVVIPTEAEVLVFSLRVGNSSTIKVLQPQQDDSSKPPSLSAKVDALSVTVDGLTKAVTSGQSILVQLDSRITALEAARPPPVINPPVNPPVVPPVVGSGSYSLYVVEDGSVVRSITTASIMKNHPLRKIIKDKGWAFSTTVSTASDPATTYFKQNPTSLPALVVQDSTSKQFIKCVPLPTDLGLSLLSGGLR